VVTLWENHGGANRYIALVMPIFFCIVRLGAAGITGQSSRKPWTGEGALTGAPGICVYLCHGNAEFQSSAWD
jgi:hypothetical protein